MLWQFNTFAQQPKWVVNNSVVDLFTSSVAPNPVSNTTNFTQNAIWDENGNLKIYAEDGRIYNALGQTIYPVSGNADCVGHSEYIFVPVPNTCNQYYAISVGVFSPGSIASSSYGLSEGLVYSIIDLEANGGLGDFVPIGNWNEPSVYIPFEHDRTQDGLADNWHVGVTKVQPNGNRYIFISGLNRLVMYEISGQGISEVFLDQEVPLWNNVSFRSELEIWQDDNELFIAFPQIHSYGNGPNGPEYYSALTIICLYVPQPGSTQLLYKWIHQPTLSYRNQDLVMVKGVEFSPDGNTIYLSRVIFPLVSNDFNILTNYVLPTDILYLKKGAVAYEGLAYPYATLNTNNSDFSFGMIESDQYGRLAIAGSKRIGRLQNANDPNSVFNPNAVNVNSVFSFADWNGNNSSGGSLNGGPGKSKYGHAIYLLPDQQDQEDLSSNFPIDQFPETLYVCSFPYQINSSIQANWWYTYANENDELVTAGLGNGLNATMPQSGVLYLSYQSNGCEVVEEVQVVQNPIVINGADFTYSTNISSGNLSISANALVTIGVTNNWELYKEINGSYVLFSTSVLGSPVFNSLDPNANYQLKHEIIPFIEVNCQYSNQTIKNIR